VTFSVGHYEAIKNMLKSWIPNITIISPESLREQILADVKAWTKKQEKAKGKE